MTYFELGTYGVDIQRQDYFEAILKQSFYVLPHKHHQTIRIHRQMNKQKGKGGWRKIMIKTNRESKRNDRSSKMTPKAKPKPIGIRISVTYFYLPR